MTEEYVSATDEAWATDESPAVVGRHPFTSCCRLGRLPIYHLLDYFLSKENIDQVVIASYDTSERGIANQLIETRRGNQALEHLTTGQRCWQGGRGSHENDKLELSSVFHNFAFSIRAIEIQALVSLEGSTLVEWVSREALRGGRLVSVLMILLCGFLHSAPLYPLRS